MNYNDRCCHLIGLTEAVFLKVQKKICRQHWYSTQSAKNGGGAPLIQVIIFPVQSPSFNYTTFHKYTQTLTNKKGGKGAF